MKNSPHRMKHQQKKAIRESQKQEYEKEASVMKDAEIKKYTTSPKTAKINRGKKNPKHKHHKTSPDDTTWETEPDSIHKEGANWMHTIQKQTLNTANRLRKKLEKYNFLKRKK